MILDAICIVHGPGDIGLYESEGVLYIYTKDKVDELPEHGRVYTIERGYNRFFIGEPDTVRHVVQQLGPLTPIEVEI